MLHGYEQIHYLLLDVRYTISGHQYNIFSLQQKNPAIADIIHVIKKQNTSKMILFS